MLRWIIPTLMLVGVAYAEPSAFVDGQRAAQFVKDGALVLDAREKPTTHLPGAVAINWRDYVDGWGRTGRLSDDDEALAAKLRALGVDDHRPVLVYGDAQRAWGEEGRIAWMLRYLGHKMTYVLDGGMAAWHGAVEQKWTRAQSGTFTIHRQTTLRVDLATVARDRTATIVDVRTPEEWRGATLHYEARGGHIPGARLLAFTSLFDASGRAVGKVDLPHDRPLYVYCTGGVRSAWATLLLRSLGYDARNFDASFWAWAADKSLPVER